MKISKNIYSILCDDVRNEVGNKLSLMGVYQQDILVHQFPTVLRSISLVVFFTELKKPISNFDIRLLLPKEEPTDFNVPVSTKTSKGGSAAIILGLSPFKLDKPGQAKFEVRIPGDEKPILIHKFIIKMQE